MVTGPDGRTTGGGYSLQMRAAWSSRLRFSPGFSFVMEPPVPAPPSRRALALRALGLSDDALLAECELDFFVASGPGGQHRNKTESGVRLTHPPTELSVTATERRSQAQNRS